ncbi:CocE/NonD family hydrolase [Sphingomonas sp. PR090111-T3T-6A]|uniref:CocE/NonD family hydrolase n=1 Tax=Sphingomonas sp. PR090111-T3T-6A TaxID=685778 RepID=UPI0003A5C933|nr:CocE/NonD family hydrolase [Sphingomonas sp. PR090111-T3T-6A]
MGEQLARRIGSLDGVGEEQVFAWLRTRDALAGNELDSLLGRLAGADRINVDDAIALAYATTTFEASRAAKQATDTFIARERARRYRIEESILIHTPQGASLAATLVRPRNATSPLPTAMLFTIYADQARNLEIAATAAAHGYAGIVVNARGKLQSPDTIRPYEVETDDTVAAIGWVSRQRWSDERVGMYGGSYSGFAAWAATKHLPRALKTIVPYAAAIPGQGLPMENNVFLNANYGWPFYVADNRTLDRKTYNDPERWSALNDRWYQSGRRYRDIDKVDGTPNPWLQRWLQHPSYDAYWQAMVPYGEDFAKIDIPVLTISGYYDDGQISALRYLKQHYLYRPKADHYLVIGPYDHFGSQKPFKDPELRGYAIDPAAQFDTIGLTFAWFDHVFRGKALPALLKDRINYEVMGANLWRHAPSLDAMSQSSRMLYLTNVRKGGRYRLSPVRPGQRGAIPETVDFADRTTTGAGYYPYPIVNRHPDLSTGLVFETEPFDHATEISGAFSGVLRARINKRDFDFLVALYELRPDGSTFALSYYLGRASYVRDITRRELLTPGAVSVLPFDRTRVVSRKLAAGSRLVIVVDVLRNGFHQINYGTGGDVGDESIADAREPLRVEWQTDSFVRIPVTAVRAGP